MLIALGALALAAACFAVAAWPKRRERAVAAATLVFGLAYTVLSEWVNVTVRETWAYAEAMPRVPPIGTGLAPLLQWLVVPLLAFHLAHRWRRMEA